MKKKKKKYLSGFQFRLGSSNEVPTEPVQGHFNVYTDGLEQNLICGIFSHQVIALDFRQNTYFFYRKEECINNNSRFYSSKKSGYIHLYKIFEILQIFTNNTDTLL